MLNKPRSDVAAALLVGSVLQASSLEGQTTTVSPSRHSRACQTLKQPGTFVGKQNFLDAPRRARELKKILTD